VKKTIKVLATPQYFSSKFFNKNKIPKIFKFLIFKGPINDQKKLKKLMSDVDAFIIGSEKIDKNIINKNKKLKIIVRFGTSLNNIDIKACFQNQILVKKLNKNINSKAVARHTLAMLMCTTNNLNKAQNEKKDYKWERNYNLYPENCTIGVVGMGNVGKIFSKYASNLGFKINYYSRKKKNVSKKFNYFSKIENLIKKSDLISIHLALNKKTRNIFNKKKLRLLKNKHLINTSRGELVEEQCLFELLKKKYILSAALDVFKNEPPKNYSLKLKRLDNVISTSHNAAYDEFTMNKMFHHSLIYIKKYFKLNK